MNPFGTINAPGLAISPNPPSELQLKSGAYYVFPQGNYLVKPGAQTALQYKDSYSGLWRTFETGAVNSPILLASDGSNYRAINLSGTIVGATVTTPGTVYNQAGTTISLAAPVAPGVTATALPVVGGSLSFVVTNGGAGYSNPLIQIPHPTSYGGSYGQCIPASASATVVAGVITAITVGFAGAGYVQVPPVTVLDPTGTGAVITASITNGTPANGGLTGIIMQNNGSLYDGTHIPAITIACTGSSGTAAATALPSLALTGVTVGGTNTGYSGTPIGMSSLGADSTAPKAVFGDPVLARSARVTFHQTAGAIDATTIEDAGSGFQTVPVIGQLVNAGSNATFVAVVGGVTNTLLFWQIG